MSKTIALVFALVTNFCVVGLTAGDHFIEQVAKVCPLVPPAYCTRSLYRVTPTNIGPVYGCSYNPKATQMEASFFYKNSGHKKPTKRIFSYCVCDDCGAYSKTMMDAASHFFSNSFVIKSKPGGYLNPTEHPKNPALEQLQHVVGTPLGDKYTCNLCASDEPMELFKAVRHVESEHPDEAQERYKQQVAVQVALAGRRTTSRTLKRLENKRKPVFVVGARTQYAQSRLRKPKDV
jgi:hypothetical protein